MTHAFISYVSENEIEARYIAAVLRHNGIEAYIGRDDLPTGLPWMQELRKAIEGSLAFIPVFSQDWNERKTTVAREELQIAIEQYRLRDGDIPWLCPVRIDECTPPNEAMKATLAVGGLNYADVPVHGWKGAMLRLLRALGVKNPDLSVGEPLGANLAPHLEITRGQIVVREMVPSAPDQEGQVYQIIGGHCGRVQDSRLVVCVEAASPNDDLQIVNELLGLNYFCMESTDSVFSADAGRPTVFTLAKRISYPAGIRVYLKCLDRRVNWPFVMDADASWRIEAHVDGGRIVGKFQCGATIAIGGEPAAKAVAASMGLVSTSFTQSGDFGFSFRQSFDPYPEIAHSAAMQDPQ